MKYDVIYTYIKEQIFKGYIKPGKKLPSIRNICKKFECSKITAAKAYDLLIKDHIIYSVPKSGYYLIENNLNMNNNFDNKSIDFSTSAPDERILPYKEFQDCLNQALNLYKKNLISPPSTQGVENLICTIQKQLQNYQIFTDKQYIFITAGSQQAINILTMMDFPNGKKNVLIEEPTYYGVIESLKLNNVNIIGINRTSKGINLYELENIFKHKDIKFFYIIPRFHNPTGFSYSNSEKKQILKLCHKYNVYIVEDDYLADLDIEKRSDPIYALDSYSKVIYVKTYSKVLLPGLRISAIVLPKEILKTFGKYKKWNDLSTSVLSQGALEIYIKSGMFNIHAKKLREVYSKRMACLNKCVKTCYNSNIIWHVPPSGFFASFEVVNSTHIDYIINELKSKNILLIDPNIFYLNTNIQKKLVRLSVSRTNTIEIEKGISKICSIIR
ncbi:putative HTH-type transcriptional regulator YdcR [Clostridium ljungdahlii DSM 13528]|uniref:HTH-type transcriptional regulator YdcR n=1 Tax=Clostridium ljungdahlii (strain ATCC 55383 / DSM 13528 / PETC) TaxID=748727 RepID=D8GPP4_CLOLD|nr:PLP-dependent aminotransferase family protein [Clostridium ljungdahlii]ADK13953.1 predicted transcriptional regulator with a HTH and aminotransferase domain [Clostridium ljungdahlii DSM 13528]OAA87445.1 putative HTH-type transcriptional regulator YdcR [Clostridium ljungdahlii DSM 13528]